MKLLNRVKGKGLVALLAGLTMAGGLTAVASDKDAIAERIKPAASVQLASAEADQAAANGAAESNGERSGEQVYNQACAACHTNGVAGAPVTGDEDAWAERIDKGMDELISSTVNGLGAMPPMAACNDCSEEEFESAIRYMTDGMW